MSSTISHRPGSGSEDADALSELAATVEQRLRSTDRLILDLDEELAVLAGLQEFPLGRFLLRNQGLNGYWTSYIFRYEPGTPTESDTEFWLLNRSLLSGARERYHRFRAEIARSITDGAVLASVPCGVMDDLVRQDYGDAPGARLVGIDIDEESLALAVENAKSRGLGDRTDVVLADAWKLGIDSEFDLLVSNGLNMYEPDSGRLVELYRNFARALRPGGRLLLSFLTPPPPPPWEAPERAGEWERYGIAEHDLRRELALFGDIIQAKYLNFVSEADTRAQLAEAGLEVEHVGYSEGGVLPVISAVRPL
ncbi:class I SAM-dependent methyltransferase [Saccharopolyspora sp. NFXS83]|uniref:SAM-dependent methyltransferase n=1 Tax=Saccharopolyspora sp. NFXS83 TaxID=2993560 RepID=UPI00224B91F5|nr:class I SAM-dependent methyltransferase [Saccharopolyspora sp. NFXS83]MCX2730644.1 class I SAM-dependent methyltransferase [Saccharopolyspora sp. NFXS83]